MEKKRKSRLQRIKGLIAHRKAFRNFVKNNKMISSFINYRHITHDLDKLLMFLFLPVSTEKIRKIHKKKAKHHNLEVDNTIDILDVIESIIDFEVARETKDNSKLTAKEWVQYIYDRKEISETLYRDYQFVLKGLRLTE